MAVALCTRFAQKNSIIQLQCFSATMKVILILVAQCREGLHLRSALRFIYKDQLYNIPRTLSKTVAMILVDAEPFGTLCDFKENVKTKLFIPGFTLNSSTEL